ncbi:MAG: class I SAM-dependent methyltransferase [Acidobacteria bacterium]|nr:class I SAM-dependent methyltransferase [Acidobacteriota bacterium]
MIPPDLTRQMQEDWNARAREDAGFYVAFGRRDQDAEEFFETAREVVRGLEWEMRRLAPGNQGARRALEIGCGPGRLLRPLSRRFGEIHGVDVSDEMIARARANLAGIPHAHAHHSSGADLAQFADDSFDFVYSYAVFQHIPSREVVFNYLREARRVLKPGGVLRCQINGLPETAARYDTWSGVRIPAGDIAGFARQSDLQLLALEGRHTQYMWTTMRKPAAPVPQRGAARIRRITNAHSSEPVAPPRGRFASITLWIENLPDGAELNGLRITIGGLEAVGTYIGPPETDGLQQLNVLLPEQTSTGLQPVEVFWNGAPLCAGKTLRVIPPPPAVPRIVSISDGINLADGPRISTGSVKLTLEEAPKIEDFEAAIDGRPVRDIDIFCADPLPPRFEINFQVPEGLTQGVHQLAVRLGRRRFPAASIEIV